MKLEIFSPYKILNHQKVLADIADGKPTYPISCEIDPSNLCNHSCIWCINGKFRKKERLMLQKDKFLDIINQLAEAKVKAITLTGGGEPLTHPEIELAMHYIREKKMEVALVTNGGLMTRPIADAVIKTCRFVRFSLDAGEEKTYKRVHRAYRNTLQDIFTWINYIRLNAPSTFIIGVAFLVHPYNYKEILTATQMVKDAGASYIQIRPVFMRGMGIIPRVLQETTRQIYEAFRIQTELFKVYAILHRFDEITQIEKAFDKCLGHHLLGVVAANGKMYLCCQLRGLERYCIGDLYKNSFKEIWASEQRKDAIKKINVERCPPCRYSTYNTVLSYLHGKKEHINFL